MYRKTITFKFPGDTVSVQHDSRPPIAGAKLTWVREDGESFKVTQKISETKITQIFRGESGKKTLVYKFNKEFTTMWVSVRIDSPKLPSPVRYTMKYKR